MRPATCFFILLNILAVGPVGVSAEESSGLQPSPTKSALNYEGIGLSSGDKFRLTTGSCPDCRTPKPALWYFDKEIIAVPSNPDHQEGQDQSGPPFLVWLGSREVIESAVLTDGGKHVRTADGHELGFRLVPKLSTNRSYYNEATQEFFSTRPLRLRGEVRETTEGRQFEVRTIWPGDWRLTPEAAAVPPEAHTLHDLIEASWTPGDQALKTYTLWRAATPSSIWNGRPIFGVILNGAQGDDDESLGGHVGIFTGRMGSHGEWADWLVNNFYDLDWVSEKGILPAMVPMDNYVGDLNSGQGYYRPSYLLVMVLKQDRVPMAYQRTIQQAFSALYRHTIDYDHARSNCAGLSIDPLRTLGWQIPLQGATNRLKAVAAVPYVTVTDRSLAKGLDAYHYLTEERTRLLPRIMFEAIGSDLLDILKASRTGRDLTPFEQWIREDVETVLFVQIPQLPSSRAWGTAPVASLSEYEQRVPADHSQWKTVPVLPRPFPEAWRPAGSHAMSFMPWILSAVLIVIPSSAIAIWMQYRHRKNALSHQLARSLSRQQE
jgi:hypothetical protein